MNRPLDILVIAAHPDDEVLGCGGTMARHAAAGDRVRVVFFTDGTGARGTDPAAAARRQTAMQTALAALGASLLAGFSFADNAMDQVPLLDLARALEGAVGGESFDVVFTHHAGDLNVDHRRVREAALTCFRPQPGGRRAGRILSFEIPSSTGWAGADGRPFAPNVHVDVAAHWPAKLAALAAYAEEMRPFPHARSVEAARALATWRGAAAGLPLAESFVLEREILPA